MSPRFALGASVSFAPDLNVNTRPHCYNPDSFMFWDGLRPTTYAHKVPTNAVYAFLTTDGNFQHTAQ